MKTIRTMLTSHHFWRGAWKGRVVLLVFFLATGDGSAAVLALCIGLIAGLLATELEWRERRRRPQTRLWILPKVADPAAPTRAKLDAGVEITNLVVQKYGTRRSFSREEIAGAEEQP